MPLSQYRKSTRAASKAASKSIAKSQRVKPRVVRVKSYSVGGYTRKAPKGKRK